MLTPQELSDAALALPETTEDEPFRPGVLVYKVWGKVFAIMHPGFDDGLPQVTLKCDPDLALHLREQYASVIPGYHVNKRHWNTVVLDGSVPRDEVIEMLEHSYERVIKGLPRADRERLLSPRAATD